MKNFIKSVAMTTVMLFGVTVTLLAQFGGGIGTSEDPYRISTVAHLKHLSTIVMNDATSNYSATKDKYFKLMNDIDMRGITDFIPIGGWSNTTTNSFLRQFSGIFDGNWKRVKNLVINKPNNDYVALFGIVNYGATISNLGIIEGNFSGAAVVGGLIAYSTATVTRCFCTGQVSSNSTSINGHSYAGGLIGRKVSGNISFCYANGVVSSYSGNNYASYAGGLIAENEKGNVANCFSISSVSANNTFCFSGYCSRAGGLIGFLVKGVVSNSYAAPSSMFSIHDKGVLVGASGGSFINCYYSTAISGINGLGYGSSANVVGKSNLEFQSANMISLLNNLQNSNTWQRDLTPNVNMGYPILGFHVVVVAPNSEVLGAGIYAKNSNSQIKVIPNTDYYFDKWSDGITSNPRTISVLSDTTLTASTLLKPLVTVISSNSTVIGAGRYSPNQQAIIRIIPNNGFSFERWSDGNISNPRTITVTNDITLTAILKYQLEGSGTAADPYLIMSLSDLKIFRNLMNNSNTSSSDRTKYYKLGVDIDLSSESNWTPIGSSEIPYNGNFDGNNRKIRNMKIMSPMQPVVGFFGYLQSARIRNLGIAEGLINTSKGVAYSGLLTGFAINSTFENCWSTGTLSVNTSTSSSNQCAGGLVGGLINSCYVVNCYTDVSIDQTAGNSASIYSGGLVGNAAQGRDVSSGYGVNIVNSYARGSIYSISDGNVYSGGIVGITNGVIKNCYSTNDVISQCNATSLTSTYVAQAGGICGNSSGMITDCITLCSGNVVSIRNLNVAKATANRIAFNEGGTLSNNFANGSMATLVGINENSLTQVTILSNANSNSGKTMSSGNVPENMLNAYIIANPKVNGIPLINWAVFEGMNSDYPSFSWQKIVTYTLTTNAVNGSVVGGGVYEKGVMVTLTATPAVGYHFVKWNDGIAQATRIVSVDSDKTYTAAFAVNQFAVSFNSQGGSNVATQTIDYNGFAIRPTDPIRQEFRFLGWYKDSAFNTEWNFGSDKVTNDITLYAKWTSATSIDDHQMDSVVIYAEKNNIIIESLPLNLEYSIFTIEGKKVVNGKSIGERINIALSSGAYIVKIGSKGVKVVLK